MVAEEKSSSETNSEGGYLYTISTAGAAFIDNFNSIVRVTFVRSLLISTHQRRCVTWQENGAFRATIRGAPSEFALC